MLILGKMCMLNILKSITIFVTLKGGVFKKIENQSERLIYKNIFIIVSQ